MAMQVERYIPSPYVLHRKKPVSDICEHGFVEYFYSKNDLKTGNLEFVVEGNSDHVIVPSKTYLKLGLRLTGKSKRTENNAQLTPTTGANISVINNIFSSVFETVEVHMNNQMTTKTDKHHPYSAYLQTLCNYGSEALDTYFELTGWSKDTAGKMEFISKDNVGWEERFGYFDKNGGEGEFIGKLCSPIFFQDKILPTMVSMRVVLKKAADAFVLLHEEGQFELQITEATLMVQKVAVVAGVKNSYIRMLEEDHAIPYFLRTPSVNYYTIEKYASQFMRDDLFLGKIPRRIVIGMVETDSYHGKSDKNPFNFQHFGLIEIGLYKDGMPFPRPLLKLDIEKNECAEAYHNFMTSLNASYTRNVPYLSLSDFKNGYTLFSYDMSPDQLGSSHPKGMLNMNSNIRLEMKFKKGLDKNITLLVYSEHDHLMEIHRDRRVTVDF